MVRFCVVRDSSFPSGYLLREWIFHFFHRVLYERIHNEPLPQTYNAVQLSQILA